MLKKIAATGAAALVVAGLSLGAATAPAVAAPPGWWWHHHHHHHPRQVCEVRWWHHHRHIVCHWVRW